MASMPRKRKSGSQYKKERITKEKRQDALTKNMQKSMEIFFKSSQKSTESTIDSTTALPLEVTEEAPSLASVISTSADGCNEYPIVSEKQQQSNNYLLDDSKENCDLQSDNSDSSDILFSKETQNDISSCEIQSVIEEGEEEDISVRGNEKVLQTQQINEHVLENESFAASTNNINVENFISIDPATIINKTLSVDEKQFILKQEPCQPSNDILSSPERCKMFGEKKRHCSQEIFWHDKNENVRRQWVSYSLSTNAVFYIPCILFTDETSRNERIRKNRGNAFVSQGFSNWKKQIEKIHIQEKSGPHIEAKVAQALFINKCDIKSLIDTGKKECETKRLEKVKENRELVSKIVNIIIFLGKQGLPLRGHRELLTDNNENNGNFLEMLNFLGKYDSQVKNHLDKVAEEHERIISSSKFSLNKKRGRGSKVTFLSHNTQEKLIQIIGEKITGALIDKIKKSAAWSLIVDSTPDVTHKEQLSICIRLISSSGEISEHLFACKEAEKTTGLEIFELIAKAFESKNVKFDKLVAQTYDGASNMSGCYKGLQAIVKEKLGSQVTYVHCYAHSLNLVLKDSVEVETTNVMKLFDDLSNLHNLFNRSMKIHQLFKRVQEEKEIEILTIKRLNTVRWSSRELCLNVFCKRYSEIMEVLKEVERNREFDERARATSTGLLHSFERKEIVTTAILFREIFAITGPLNKYLQSVNIDVGKVSALSAAAKQQIQELRNDPERVLKKSDDFPEVKWDDTRRSHGKETRWRQQTFLPVIDQILSSLHNRFDQNKKLFNSIMFFQPRSYDTIRKNFNETDDLAESINEFCNLYKINTQECAQELKSFAYSYAKLESLLPSENQQSQDEFSEENKIEDHIDDNEDGSSESGENNARPSDNTSSAIKPLKLLTDTRFQLLDAYPLLCRALSIIVAIPVSSCSAERSFSVLKRVKSRLRSTMLQRRLESLLQMAIEKKIVNNINIEEVIDAYGKSSVELSKHLLP